MSISITIKKCEESGEAYIDFADICELFDEPDLVDSYEFDELECGNIALRFYDKAGVVISPKGNE